MLRLIKRVVTPVVRLTTVDEVDYEKTFETFAGHLARAVVEEKARREPRIVSLRKLARGAEARQRVLR
jgi:hypothetical protein